MQMKEGGFSDNFLAEFKEVLRKLKASVLKLEEQE